MENGPFSTEEFAESFAADVVLFAHVASRVDGRKDDDLLHQLGRHTYPSILFLDADGAVLGEHAAMGARNVRSFRAALEEVRVVREAKANPVGDDVERGAALLAAEIELGRCDFDAASARLEALGELSTLTAKRLKGLVARLEFDKFMAELRRRRGSPAEARTRILEMLESGRIPTGLAASGFWMQGVMSSALALRDRPLAERALEALSADRWFENEPHDFIGAFVERIAQLPKDG